MRSKLSRFLNHPVTEGAIIALILGSVALLVIEHAYPIGDRTRARIELAGDAVTGLFAGELVIRFFVAPAKLRFLRKYWIDILGVLPLFRPLRFLRVIQLLRLIRMGSLFNRYLSALSQAFQQTLRQQLIIAIVVAVLVLSVGVLLFLLEGPINPAFATVAKSLWWSVMSLVTDQPMGGEPVTALGRALELLTFVGSIGLMATLAGLVSASMVNRLAKEVRDMDVSELRGHVVIGGWNRAGPIIVRELLSATEVRDAGVVIISQMESTPVFSREIDAAQVFFIGDDYTKVEVLERAGIRRAAMAILLADKSTARSDQDRDARTVLAALTIEKLHPGIFTCVELLNRENEAHLRMAGVEEIVVADEYAGNVIATASRNRGLVAVLDDLLTTSYGSSFFRVALPEGWSGRTAGWALTELKEHHNATLISLERRVDGRRSVMVNPKPGEPLRPGDVALVIGEKAPRLGA